MDTYDSLTNNSTIHILSKFENSKAKLSKSETAVAFPLINGNPYTSANINIEDYSPFQSPTKESISGMIFDNGPSLEQESTISSLGDYKVKM